MNTKRCKCGSIINVNNIKQCKVCGQKSEEMAVVPSTIKNIEEAKLIDLLEEISDDLLALDLQLVFLGTGDEKYHDFLKHLERKYSDRVRAFLTYDNQLAHLIEAGADIFLMPSHYEPCGLNQMYSLKYGTVPIVRKTGGLADTVIDFDESSATGTGFVFEDYLPKELLRTIRRAVALFSRRRLWYKIIKQGMSQDFSWAQSARKYLDLYPAVAHLIH